MSLARKMEGVQSCPGMEGQEVAVEVGSIYVDRRMHVMIAGKRGSAGGKVETVESGEAEHDAEGSK